MDIKKLKQDKTDLKDVWEYLAIETPFPDKDVRVWLLDYDKDMIQSAFTALARREDAVNDPVKWMAGKLRNAKEQNMTPEERENYISELRAGAARVKAQKQHSAKVKAEKEAFAQLLQKDAEVCTNLQDVPVPVLVPVSVSLSGSVAVAAPASVSIPTSKAKTPANLDEKKGEPTPNPVRASSSLANQGNTKTKKHSRRNCPKCDEPLYRDQAHVCCNCVRFPGCDEDHAFDCAVSVAERVAKYGSELGVPTL
jgi:hypothetical protein